MTNEKWLTDAARQHAAKEADRWYMDRSHLPEARRWYGTHQRAAAGAREALKITERDEPKLAPFFDVDEYARVFFERLVYLCSAEGTQAGKGTNDQ